MSFNVCDFCGSSLVGDGLTVVRYCPKAGFGNLKFIKPELGPLTCCQCSNPSSRRYCIQCHPYWAFGDTDADPSSFDVPDGELREP